jgi:hypothetical protein
LQTAANPTPSKSNAKCSTNQGVRERPVEAGRYEASQEVASGLAHPSKPVVAQLNERWRVIDDPLQWILQRRKGNPRAKNSGWEGKSFCRTREGLLQCVREKCGDVDPDAEAALRDLPEWHLDWDSKNLDVHGTDQAHGTQRSIPLAAKASEDSDAEE